MFAAARCFFVALAIAAVPVVAVAQVIPPSELPGRERERFTEPPTPQAQPAGPSITLPSTVAPRGVRKCSSACAACACHRLDGLHR